MSCVISVEGKSAVFLATDGAIYSAEGILMDVRRKVFTSERDPIAVSFRGHAAWGQYISEEIVRLVERVGFDRALEVLARQMPELAATTDGKGRIEVLIAGMSESLGPRHMFFQTAPNAGMEACKLIHPGWDYVGANTYDGGLSNAADLRMRARRPDDTAETWYRDLGLCSMEYYRRHPGNLKGAREGRETGYAIGGQVDFTVIDAAGARTSTIHRWEGDKIGEPINPFATSRSVLPMSIPARTDGVTPSAGMNRQQRRALKRSTRGKVAA